MYKVVLTIGHKIGPVELLDTPTICATITESLKVDAFTALPCVGMWKGVPENSTRIEIVTDEQAANAIVGRVPELCRQLNQEAIMVEAYPANVSFPTAIVAA